MKNNHDITIFIPCFNEEKNIPALVNSWSNAIDNKQNIFVLFINNGSTDNTLELIKNEISIIDNKNLGYFHVQHNKGYGYGILEAINQDDNCHICWTHADLQFSANEVVQIVEKYLETKDKIKVYKGTRASRFITDVLFTKLMSLVGFIFKGYFLSDINAQPKILPRSVFVSISKWPKDFLLDAHLLYECKRNKIRIVNNKINLLPRLHEDAKGGGSFKGKFKLSISTLKYFLGNYAKY